MNIDPEVIQAFIEALVALIESCKQPEEEVVKSIASPTRGQQLALLFRVRGVSGGFKAKRNLLRVLRQDITNEDDAAALLNLVKEAA